MLEKDKGKMNKHQIILNKKNTKKNGNDKKTIDIKTNSKKKRKHSTSISQSNKKM